MMHSEIDDMETKLAAAFSLPFSSKRQPHLRGFLRDAFNVLDDGEGVDPTAITSYIFSRYQLSQDFQEVRDKVTAHLFRGMEKKIFKYIGDGRFVVNNPNVVVCGVCGGNKKKRTTKRPSRKGSKCIDTMRRKNDSMNCRRSSRRQIMPPNKRAAVLFSDNLRSKTINTHSSGGSNMEFLYGQY